MLQASVRHSRMCLPCTGSKPLAVHFVPDRAPPAPSGLHQQQPGGPPRPAGDSWRAGIPRPELSASDDSSVNCKIDRPSALLRLPVSAGCGVPSAAPAAVHLQPVAFACGDHASLISLEARDAVGSRLLCLCRTMRRCRR